ncbi:hypothetical protein OSI80_17860, partial [Mycobacterium ulcerans]
MPVLAYQCAASASRSGGARWQTKTENASIAARADQLGVAALAAVTTRRSPEADPARAAVAAAAEQSG